MMLVKNMAFNGQIKVHVDHVYLSSVHLSQIYLFIHLLAPNSFLGGGGAAVNPIGHGQGLAHSTIHQYITGPLIGEKHQFTLTFKPVVNLE